ncbi:MAG TPA: NUDIX hydrolase [Nocardioidaceae bacterium]|nr:NUDIX hydrolase [Nocardioidaceae bacterium]
MVYTSDYPFVYLTVDIVVLTIRDDKLQALAVRRGEEPYAGKWALPGGFVGQDEDLEVAALRELREETAVTPRGVRLEQLKTYGAPRRDPRHRVISVAWLAVLPEGPDPVAGTDAASAEWQPVEALLKRGQLAFDHAVILTDGMERARAKIEYSSLALSFVRREFTIADLRRVYEVVWGRDLDAGNFHRKVTGAQGLVVATGRQRNQERGRPAELYVSGGADALHPPLTREVLR